MDPRERWQALQARLTAARTFLDAGDRAHALAEVTAALEIDPCFLAAVVLRERILNAEAERSRGVEPGQFADSAIPQRRATSLGVATHDPPAPARTRPVVSEDGYARFEQRTKRRRTDRKIEIVRRALAEGRLREAASALDDVIELDPNQPELADLTAAFGQLRTVNTGRHVGPVIAASLAFGAVVLGSTWLYDGRVLLSHPVAALTSLVEVRSPKRIRPPVAGELEPMATSGRDADSPQRVAVPRGAEPQPEARPIASPPRPSASIAPPAVQTSQPSQPVPPPAPPPARPVPIDTRPAVQESLAIASAAFVPLAPVPTASADGDEAQVKAALQRYRTAYEGLDARLARTVYPAVNQAALARAFAGIESQTLTFDVCDVRLHGDGATVTCRGSARYVPKVGSREPRIEPRNWTFALRKTGTDWTIESARTDR